MKKQTGATDNVARLPSREVTNIFKNLYFIFIFGKSDRTRAFQVI